MSADHARTPAHDSPGAGDPAPAGGEASAGNDRVAAAALAGLPDLWHRRLREAVRVGPALAWSLAGRGRLHEVPALACLLGDDGPRLGRVWAEAAERVDLGRLAAAHRDAGVEIATRADPAMPACLAVDVDAPEVLFRRGDPDLLARPTVAVVGTRRCSRYGRDLAASLGRALAEAGVAVVSGLALGIDAAAHEAALAAHLDAPDRVPPPVAVVGSGLDVPYPRRNAALWSAVARHGLLLGEYPLGTPPARWRFPCRNRLIAAVADVTVVVESHERGGALITAEEAMARGRAVLAVPGSVHSPASTGPNRLLGEFALPCLGPDSVLSALESASGATDARTRAAPPPDADADLLDAFDGAPASVDQLVLRTGRSVSDVSLALARLEAVGRVAGRAGWFEAVGR